MKHFATRVLFAVALAVALTGCANAQQAPAAGGAQGGLTMITGNEQGTYYRFGGVLAGKISETSDTKVQTVASGGSQENINALAGDLAQLGFTQSDVLEYATQGTRLFDKKAEGISAVAELYKEQVQIVTLDPKLQSVADLKGKNVSIGAEGSGVYFNAIDVLGSYGLTEKDISATYQSFSDSVEALQNGKIDAAFVVAGAPTSAISGLAATTNIYLIGLDDEHINRLLSGSSHYSVATIDSRMYNTPKDVQTVAVSAVLVARDDVSEDDVYNVVSGIYENKDAIARQHSKGEELDLKSAAANTIVPYHPGAVRYYKEKGIAVPAE